MPQTSQVTDVIGTFKPVKVGDQTFSFTVSAGERRPTDGHGQLFKRTDIREGKPTPHILSIDFDDAGEILMTSESDETIQLYSVKDGRHDKSLLSKKYGVKLAQFTHTSSSIIYASTKTNDAIRYLATHDNSFIRYFEGHTAAVTCLSMHPGSDAFLSCSRDNTVRIWDVSDRRATGILQLHSPFLSAWDPSGTIFAVASPAAACIVLYDHRNFGRGPFATFDLVDAAVSLVSSGGASGGNSKVEVVQQVEKGWTKLAFANDGKHILVGTRGQGHFLLDAFDGTLRAYLRKPEGPHPPSGPSAATEPASSSKTAGAGSAVPSGPSNRLAAGETPPETAGASSSPMVETSGDCAFTPDGRFVVSGAGTATRRAGNVLVWDTLPAAAPAVPTSGTTATVAPKILDPTHVLEDPRREAAVLAVNPRFNFFATADQDLVFWTPDLAS